MTVRLEPAKLETSHSDEHPCVAALLAESKASVIRILGHWLPGFVVGTAVDQGPQERARQGPFVDTKVAGRSIQVCRLHRHAGTELHRLATEALRNGDAIGSLPALAASTCQELLERLRTGGFGTDLPG